MTLGITRNHGLLSRWKRPICELLQHWRKNLASLVFFVIILINLFGVTLGTVDKGSNMVVVKRALVLEGSIGVNIKETTGLSGKLGLLHQNHKIIRRNTRGVRHNSEDKRQSIYTNQYKENKVSNESPTYSPKTNHQTKMDKSCLSQSFHDFLLKDRFKEILSNLTDTIPSAHGPKQGYNTYVHQQKHIERFQHIPKNSSTITATTKDSLQNITSEVCSQAANYKKSTNTKPRRQRLRIKTLPFCSMFYADSARDICDENCTDEKINEGNENTCRNCIDAILKRDKAAYAMFSHFQQVALQHFDCRDYTSMRWKCDDCEKAYKNWLCSMTIPFYRKGELIPPCSFYCQEVEKKCPYILPEHEYQYVGQPSFLCTVPEIPNQTFSSKFYSKGECHNLTSTGLVEIVSMEHLKDSSDTNTQLNQIPSQTPKTTLPNQSYSQNNDANQRTPSSSHSDKNSDSNYNNNKALDTRKNDINSDNKIEDLNSKTNSDTSKSVRMKKLDYSDNAGRTVEPWEKDTSVSTEENTSSTAQSLHHKQWLAPLTLAQILFVLFWDGRIVSLVLSVFHASGNT